jgi:hypothetical protein
MAISRQLRLSFTLGALAEALIGSFYVGNIEGSAPLNARPIFRDTDVPEQLGVLAELMRSLSRQ